MRLGLETVTLTPGNGIPWSSEMTPRRAPVSLDWEMARGAMRRRRMAMNKSAFTLMETSFPI
jgi:hypothetical protein